MQILMLSWEYPPQNIGGLGRHVYELSQVLVKEGIKIHVVCPGSDKLLKKEDIGGVKVHRVPFYIPAPPDFITWVLQMNFSLLEYAMTLVSTTKIVLIHAHDWLVAYATRVLKQFYRLPVVVTIHATEYGRNHGLHTIEQKFIGSIEWWLTYEAWKVICCSEYMKNELKHIFQLPEDKIRLIVNGVNPKDFTVSNEFEEKLSIFRKNYAHPEEKMVFYIGRLVPEKGVQVLLDAIPQILNAYSKTKFVIAGSGPSEDFLKNRAKEMGFFQQVYFTGYIDDQTRNQLYRCADVAVFPSLYEPFGLVVLEAMAAGTPVVVSDVGGISEIVREGIDGLKAQTGSSFSLANRILEILHNPELGNRLKEEAYAKVITEYSWNTVAQQTILLYEEILKASAQNDWVKGRSYLQQGNFS